MSTTCLAVALCLVLLSASAEEDIVLQTCWKQCVDYKRWGYDCAMRAGCFEKLQIDEDAFSACFQPCNVGASACEKLCHQNYEDLKGELKSACVGGYGCSLLSLSLSVFVVVVVVVVFPFSFCSRVLRTQK